MKIVIFMKKHVKALVLGKDSGICQLIAISVNAVSKRTGVYIEDHVLKSSDDIESDEKFDIVLVNEFPSLKELIENKNILLSNFGKVVLLTSYQIDIEDVNKFSHTITAVKKEPGSDFMSQIERIIFLELRLVKPMKVLSNALSGDIF